MRRDLILKLAKQGSELAVATIDLLLTTDMWWKDDGLVKLCRRNTVEQDDVRQVLVLVSVDNNWLNAHRWWPAVEAELVRDHSRYDDDWDNAFIHGACLAVLELRRHAQASRISSTEFVTNFPKMVASMIFTDYTGPNSGPDKKNSFGILFDELLKYGFLDFGASEIEQALQSVPATYRNKYEKFKPGLKTGEQDALSGQGRALISGLFYSLAKRLNSGERADLVIQMSRMLSPAKLTQPS